MSASVAIRDGMFPSYAINRSECIRKVLKTINEPLNVKPRFIAALVLAQFGIPVTDHLVYTVRKAVYGTKRKNYTDKGRVQSILRRHGVKKVLRWLLENV